MRFRRGGLVIIAVWLGAWRIGKGFALFALLASLYIIYSGYSEHAAVTLALTPVINVFQPADRHSTRDLQRATRGYRQDHSHGA
ncbi:Uncharacterised protein [Raoultella planticola]|nr:Uncharacterised protein [Raoultella planticola]